MSRPRIIAGPLASGDDVAALSAALRPLLEAEWEAGNAVVETWRGWPSEGTVGVILVDPFRVVREPPAGVTYREVGDPHYWRAEFYDERTGHVLACRF